MFLSFNTDARSKRIGVYFNNEGRLFLLRKLCYILEENDHEFFVLGSELQEYEYKESSYHTCDFVNILNISNTQKEGIEVLINKTSNLYTVILYLSSKAIEDLICCLKKIDPHNTEFQINVNHINSTNNKSLMYIMKYAMIL